MKKILFTVIAVLIAALIVTCDMFQPEEAVEYTDVVYSEDGSRVTLYLDGVGVPKTQAQRAMTTRLSKMAYDYLDVVFKDPSTTPATIARAQWDLGQSAGISGVSRDTATAYTKTNAILVAGLKNGKTLLGIGDIQEIDGALDSSGVITSDTTSVTFYVSSVKTGLLVKGETATASGNDYGILFDSIGGASWNDSTRTKLGNAEVPTYPLNTPKWITGSPGHWDTQDASYEFYGALDSSGFTGQLTYASTTAKKIFVEPRFPRYMDNGRYRLLLASIDTLSTVEVTPGTTFTTFVNPIPLTFTPKGSGVFSFYIEIPVYVLFAGATVTQTTLEAEKGTNAGALMPIRWNIRTGVGSELYSLDDGAASGGCVLMTIGKMSLEDWLEIQWKWEDEI